jgi:hypothetical protein
MDLQLYTLLSFKLDMKVLLVPRLSFVILGKSLSHISWFTEHSRNIWRKKKSYSPAGTLNRFLDLKDSSMSLYRPSCSGT